MKVVAAYLLAVLGGNNTPSVSDVKKILSSVGADAEDSQIENLIAQVGDNNVFDLIESGKAKLASVPTGGASGAVSASSAAPAAAEAKEEKKVESSSEEEDDDAFGGLF